MPKNPFAGGNSPMLGARDIVPVVPGTPFGFTAIGLYVTVGGVVVLVTEAGATRTVTVAANEIIPVGCTNVVSAGTTATGIHAYMYS